MPKCVPHTKTLRSYANGL